MNQNTLKQNKIVLLQIALLFSLLMFLFRVLFVSLFGRQLVDWPNELAAIAQTFILGFRFDLGIAAYAVLPALILLYVSGLIANLSFHRLAPKIHFLSNDFRVKLQNKIFSLVKIYLSLIASVLFILHLCDLVFYSHFQDRFNALVFALLDDDTMGIIKTLIADDFFILQFVSLIGLIAVSFYLIKFSFSKALFISRIQNISSRLNFHLLFVVLFLFFALVGRGNLNFKMFPLGIMHTEISTNIFLNKASYNSIKALKDAFKQRKLISSNAYNLAVEMGYPDIRKAFADYFELDLSEIPPQPIDLMIQSSPKQNQEQIKNVVVIMMESFGSHWLEYQSDSFDILGNLKKHFTEDYSFFHFFPAANGTYPSLMASLASLPATPMPLADSKYVNLSVESAGAKSFLDAGFDTSYLYGGGLSWRNLSSYLGRQHFNQVLGSQHIHKKIANVKEHDWGVFDEYFFEYLWQHLQESQSQKNFVFALSTTNHPPFQVPSTYKKANIILPEQIKTSARSSEAEVMDRFQTYRYANEFLAKFIDRLKSSPMAENTLLVVTGDHNFFALVDYKQEEFLKKYGVPLYFYIPKNMRKNLVYKPEEFYSSLDIFPSLIDLSLSEQKYITLGKNIFAPRKNYFGLNDHALIANKEFAMQYKFLMKADANKNWQVVDWQNSADYKMIYENLSKKRRSALAITDYFLREQLKSNRTKRPTN